MVASSIQAHLISAQDSLHHFAVHVRQAEVPALVLEGELGVLDAEQVHHGRVQVVDVVFGDVVAVVVGLAASAAVQLELSRAVEN